MIFCYISTGWRKNDPFFHIEIETDIKELYCLLLNSKLLNGEGIP